MISRIQRILKSIFSMPVWVIVWVFGVLVPANFSGIFMLHTETGFWVAILGSLGVLCNVPILFLNGGMSKVLAIPHLIFWIPLHFILFNQWSSASDISSFEKSYLIVILAINTVSLAFDAYDANQWRKGNRDVSGFPSEPVRL